MALVQYPSEPKWTVPPNSCDPQKRIAAEDMRLFMVEWKTRKSLLVNDRTDSGKQEEDGSKEE